MDLAKSSSGGLQELDISGHQLGILNNLKEIIAFEVFAYLKFPGDLLFSDLCRSLRQTSIRILNADSNGISHHGLASLVQTLRKNRKFAKFEFPANDYAKSSVITSVLSFKSISFRYGVLLS